MVRDRSYSARVTHKLHVRNMKPAGSEVERIEGSTLCGGKKSSGGEVVRSLNYVRTSYQSSLFHRVVSRSSLFPARSTSVPTCVARKETRKGREGEREGNGGGEMAERRGIKGMDKWREDREGVDARLKI